MHKGWVAISQGNKELRKENVTLKANGAYSRGAKGSPGGRRDGGLVVGGTLKRESSVSRRHVFMYLPTMFGVKND